MQAFTEEELRKVGLPKSWEIFYNSLCYEDQQEVDICLNRLEIFPILTAIYKLRLLRDCYRQGKDIKTADYKYNIYYNNKLIEIDKTFNNYHFLSFQTRGLRDKFLKNFRNLIEQAGDLI